MNFTRRMATGISFGRQRTIVPVIRQPLPSGILNIALSVTPRPAFFYPVQPPSHFNPERATFYRDKPDARALAWYLPDSYLCVLLDGHHKATAAALEGRPLKTLVLSTATHFNDEQQTLVFPGGECLHKTELQYHIPKLTACKTLPPSAWESFGPDKHISPSETWSEELKQSVSRYPRWIKPGKLLRPGI